MAKEAIETIKEAEAKAQAILQEATQNAKNIRQEAEVLAEERYKSIIEEGDREARGIRERAIKEAEEQSKPILEKGLDEAKKILEIPDNMIDGAVNIIIERIVNTNGNS